MSNLIFLTETTSNSGNQTTTIVALIVALMAAALTFFKTYKRIKETTSVAEEDDFLNQLIYVMGEYTELINLDEVTLNGMNPASYDSFDDFLNELKRMAAGRAYGFLSTNLPKELKDFTPSKDMLLNAIDKAIAYILETKYGENLDDLANVYYDAKKNSTQKEVKEEEDIAIDVGYDIDSSDMEEVEDLDDDDIDVDVE